MLERSRNLDQDEILKVLEKMFEVMQQNGQVTPAMGVRKNEIFESIANALNNPENNLSYLNIKDLQNDEVQKKLMGAIASKVLGVTQEFDKFINELKDPDARQEKNPALDKKLLNAITLLNELLKLLKNDPNKKNDPKYLINSMMGLFKKELDKKCSKDQDDEKEEMIKTLEKEMENTLRNLFGGDNPTISGEISTPVIGPIFGNLFGFTNQTIPDPNSVAEMVENNTYNSGRPDPLGLENIVAEAIHLDDIHSSLRGEFAESKKLTPY